ncbi:MAG: hypothetical protein P4L68_09800 [Methylovirgula sp.]|nr:hypothetical protein [Methylovirgula sp.]
MVPPRGVSGMVNGMTMTGHPTLAHKDDYRKRLVKSQFGFSDREIIKAQVRYPIIDSLQNSSHCPAGFAAGLRAPPEPPPTAFSTGRAASRIFSWPIWKRPIICARRSLSSERKCAAGAELVRLGRID